MRYNQSKQPKVGQRTHGRTGTKAYYAWANMITRCNNPQSKNSKEYSQRGITVCQQWIDSFQDFYTHIGDPPSPAHQLDRINNDGNYEPGNVRWATKVEQMSNTRLAKWIECNGIKDTISGWARRLGMGSSRLSSRVKKMGIESAINLPRRKHPSHAAQ